MGFLEVAGRIVTAILSLVLVLALAYFVLRWMGKRAPGVMSGKGRMITVLDRVSTGRNSGMMLVRVGERVLLVAYSEHNVEKVYDFDDPDGKFVPPLPPGNMMNFSDALKEAASKFGAGKKNGGGDGL